MIDRLRAPLIFGGCLLFFGWIGLKTFNYFTHANPPAFTLKGIDHNGSYARQASGIVSANNDYKVARITITVDGKELLTQWVKSKQFEFPFTIDTTTLADGQHTMDIEAMDSSYHANKTQKQYIFLVDNTPLRAVFADNEYRVDQGKTIHMKIQSNKPLANAEVKLFSKTFNFYPESDDSTTYECFIPVDCEERANDYMVTADIEDLVKNKAKLTCKVQIKDFEFKRQRGFTVGESKLAQEKELSMSMKILNESLEKWVNASPKKKLWSGPFEYPVEVQRMTTPFGEIRMTPERGRYMHKGVDLINRPKCVVWAAQSGKVVIKDRFLLTGNTIVIDHGLGVFTLYAHLEEYADIEVGDMIKKGNPVGKLGMTGYATGYHLHWELRVNNVPVDPLEWIKTVY
jgi:murein DD-endopeptidase MepM/ murein hydrolase activator NlpD